MLAFLAASAFLFVFPRSDRAGRADVVFVLAGGNPRLRKGLALVRAGVAPTLVIDGGLAPEWPEANRVCRGRFSFRVLCFRADPFSTRGEAEALRRLAREHGWRSAVVVTSSYHAFRARLIVRRCFPAARVVSVRSRWLVMPVYVASEWAKLALALTTRRGC